MKNNQDAQFQNILMVSDDFLPAATGVGVHLQIICKELVRQGHHVVVLTSKQAEQKKQETWEGVQIYRAPSLKMAGFYQALPNPFRVQKIIREHKIGIVHFHYLSLMMLLVAGVIKNRSLKKIYTYHFTEAVLTQVWFMRPFRKLIGAAIVRFANTMDQVICPSSKLKEQVVKNRITKPVHTLTNPLVQEFFYQKEAANLRVAPFQILYAGRLNREKNIPLLLKAFALHLRTHPESRLWIVGKGDMEMELKEMAQNLQILEHVDFLGFMSHAELAIYYNSCDTFVLPSVEETQGMVVMEAMSFSKPVIVTREIVSASELVTVDHNGYIVDAYDPQDLAIQLDLLAGSQSTRARLGYAGRQMIKMYSPSLVTNKLIHIYVGAAGEFVEEQASATIEPTVSM